MIFGLVVRVLQDAEIKGPLVGAQGYQRFPLSKPAVGWNVGLHAVPVYRASTYLVSAFPAHSTYINFCFAMIIITHRG